MGVIYSKEISDLSSKNKILLEKNLLLNDRLKFLDDEIKKLKKNSNITAESSDAFEKKLQSSITKFVDNILKNDNINSALIPDYIERQIYTNVFTVFVSLLKEIIEDTNINIFNQTIKFKMESE